MGKTKVEYRVVVDGVTRMILPLTIKQIEIYKDKELCLKVESKRHHIQGYNKKGQSNV